ncbi:Tumor necrosis factor (ligand) superfamily [Mactra antiquata]
MIRNMRVNSGKLIRIESIDHENKKKTDLCFATYSYYLNSDAYNVFLQQISEEYLRIRQREQENLDNYINDESNKEILAAVYSNDYWEMKPAGRVTGLTLDEPLKNKDKNAMETIRNWKCGNKLQEKNGFLRQGVRYNNGRLVVPAKGSYFVYSFVDFKESCNRETGKPDIEDINIPLKHSIYKFNIKEGRETEVVSGLHPHKVSLSRYYNSYSSYISSLIELVAGDEISIKVMNITNIDYAENNYFGLYLV